MENQNQIPIIEKQSRSKLKLAIAVCGFLTLGFSSTEPPIFFIILLCIVAFLSLISLIINLIKRKVDIVSILMFISVALISIPLFSALTQKPGPIGFSLPSAIFYTILSLSGISFIFTASILSLLEFFNPNLIKNKKFIFWVLLLLILYLGGSAVFYLFNTKYTMSADSERIEVSSKERKWIHSDEYIINLNSKHPRIILWENGEKRAEYQKKDRWGTIDVRVETTLLPIVYKINSQLECILSKTDIKKIKQENKIAELIFENSVDIITSQKIEREKRDHVLTDKKGYRILENTETVIFILEDNLNQGLEGYVLVGQNIKGEINYDCWVIDSNKKEVISIEAPFLSENGTKEKLESGIDKTWIDELNKVLEKG